MSTGVLRWSESDSKSVTPWQSGEGDIADERIRKVCKNAVLEASVDEKQGAGRRRLGGVLTRAKGKVRPEGPL